VHLCGAADRHLADGVDAVVAQAVVLVGARAGSELLWGWLGRWRPGRLVAGGLARSQRCKVWWKRSTFALGLRVAGRSVLLTDPEQGQEVFKGVAVPACLASSYPHTSAR